MLLGRADQNDLAHHWQILLRWIEDDEENLNLHESFKNPFHCMCVCADCKKKNKVCRNLAYMLHTRNYNKLLTNRLLALGFKCCKYH